MKIILAPASKELAGANIIFAISEICFIFAADFKQGVP